MRILVIPDSHLKIEVIENGLELAKELNADNTVLLGDYFDDWGAKDQDYYDMLAYLKTILRRTDVVGLFGNHDLSYCGYLYPGFNRRVAKELRPALISDFRLLYCVEFDNILYSHAGVTNQWMLENKVIIENDLRYRVGKKAGASILEGKVNKAGFEKMNRIGPARGGKEAPSPLWADLTELLADAVPNVKQVVGHTPISNIQMMNGLWFTDVYSNSNESDEYLLVVDGVPEIVHYNKVMEKQNG